MNDIDSTANLALSRLNVNRKTLNEFIITPLILFSSNEKTENTFFGGLFSGLLLGYWNNFNDDILVFVIYLALLFLD